MKVRIAPARLVGAYDISLESTGTVAKLTLSGRLDAAAIPQLRNELANAAASKPKKLALLLDGCLSLGPEAVRAVVFETEKLEADVQVIAVGANADIKRALSDADFSDDVVFADRYVAADIER